MEPYARTMPARMQQGYPQQMGQPFNQNYQCPTPQMGHQQMRGMNPNMMMQYPPMSNPMGFCQKPLGQNNFAGAQNFHQGMNYAANQRQGVPQRRQRPQSNLAQFPQYTQMSESQYAQGQYGVQMGGRNEGKGRMASPPLEQDPERCRQNGLSHFSQR